MPRHDGRPRSEGGESGDLAPHPRRLGERDPTIGGSPGPRGVARLDWSPSGRYPRPRRFPWPAIGAYEAQVHLASLLHRVQAGERFVITRHGVPIAVLEPVRPGGREDIQRAVDGLRELRKGLRLGGLKVRGLIDEGRRGG